MRFIHTADIHLGAIPDSNMPWGELRAQEIWNTFKNLIDVVKEKKPEVFLIAGDLFHRQPKMSELKEVNYLFESVAPTRVVLIAGNHDPVSDASNYNGFKWGENVFFLKEDEMQILSFEDIETDIYGFSYHKKIIKESLYDDVVPMNKNRINILLAHGGDESHIPMNMNKIMSNGFSYVACGHLHLPFLHNEARYAYCGALEPIDRNDKGKHGYVEGEVTQTERRITLVPFATRSYEDIEINVASNMTNSEVVNMIKEAIVSNGENNIFHITIKGFRDADIEFDKTEIGTIGNVISVNDLSEPDFDFEKLYEQNKDNMIGMFIERFGDRSKLDELHKKALYYGTSALLSSMEVRS